MTEAVSYVQSYLAAEAALRKLHGESAYFSRPTLVETGGGSLPVAPWAEFIGDPLILPDPALVPVIAVTSFDDVGQVRTMVRSADDVLRLLRALFATEHIELPVRHTIVRIPLDSDIANTLQQLIAELPNVEAR